MKKPFEFDAWTELPSDQLSAIQLVRSPGALSLFVRLLVFLFVASMLALLLVPWQQNVPATGSVSALNPFDRVQTIAAPVSGRVRESWVIEGTAGQEGER